MSIFTFISFRNSSKFQVYKFVIFFLSTRQVVLIWRFCKDFFHLLFTCNLFKYSRLQQCQNSIFSLLTTVHLEEKSKESKIVLFSETFKGRPPTRKCPGVSGCRLLTFADKGVNGHDFTTVSICITSLVSSRYRI